MEKPRDSESVGVCLSYENVSCLDVDDHLVVPRIISSVVRVLYKLKQSENTMTMCQCNISNSEECARGPKRYPVHAI